MQAEYNKIFAKSFYGSIQAALAYTAVAPLKN